MGRGLYLLLSMPQVLGIPPYEKSCFRNTEDLCREIMQLCKAPDEVFPTYVRHLALMVYCDFVSEYSGTS